MVDFFSGLLGIEEDPLLAMLPPEQRAQLMARTRQQGVQNLGLQLLQAGGPTTTPGGIGSRLGGAIMGAQQSSQGMMDRNLERLLTSRRLQQEETQRQQMESTLAGLSEEDQRLYRLLGQSGFGQVMAQRAKPPESGIQKPSPTDFTADSLAEFERTRDPRVLVRIQKSGAELNPNETIAARYMFGNANPDSWTPQQTQTWLAYLNAPDEASKARIANDAKNTFFATGGAAPVPRSRMDILSSVVGGSPQATGAPQPARAPSSVAPTVAPTTAPTTSIFEQVTPKEQQQLLLDRPRAERGVSVVVDKASRLKSLVGNLLSNEEGLKRSTGLASKVPSIPGGPAYQAQSDLKNLKERVSLETVNQMRELSKTGGAIGNITEREWPRLESALTNLDQAQSYDQIVKRLNEVNDIMDGYIRDVNKAFEDTYGTKTQASEVQMTPQSRQFLTPNGQRAYEKYR